MNRSDNKGNSLQVNKTIIAKKANFIIQWISTTYIISLHGKHTSTEAI